VLHSTGSVVEGLHNNPKTGAIRILNNISWNNYMYPYCSLNINMSHLKVITSAGWGGNNLRNVVNTTYISTKYSMYKF
jgi:hypothetical protein